MTVVPTALLSAEWGYRSYDWTNATGAVYLLHCDRTGVFKVGASVNPRSRIRQIVYTRKGGSLNFCYVWSVATNNIARVERYWCKRWKGFRVRGREWLSLPEAEVWEFKRCSSVLFRDCPEPDPVWWECVNAPFVSSRVREFKKG